jgi:hypothetical protein
VPPSRRRAAEARAGSGTSAATARSGERSELEPQVTIIRRETETIEEFRVKGRLTMVKVTPRHGRPYYLVAEGAEGAFVRRDSLDTGLRVPLWVLFSF